MPVRQHLSWSAVVALWSVAAAALLPGTPASAASPPGSPAAAAEPLSWIVNGPAADGKVSARIALDTSGRLSFGVDHQGRTVLAPGAAGVDTTAADLTTGLTFVRRIDRVVDERYTMTTGKQRERRARASETTLSFTGSGGAKLDLVVRVSADGAAYRYVLPGPVTIRREASAFTLPAGAPAWLLPYSPNYENTRVETTAAGAATGDFGFPSLFDVGGAYVLLTEADVDGRYSGARLAHTSGSGSYAVKLDDAQVSAAGPLATPWRTAIVGDLATVTASTLVDDLAPPSKLADTSWVRPGTVAWSWLSEHDSPRDPTRQKQYVDFAARNGWPYVLIDEGWNRSWVPEVVRYARARGVDVLLWFHWTSLDTVAERDTVLAQVKAWGVAGVKVDFMDSDAQARFRWYDDIAAATARHRLMLNFHGATVPRGAQRTWPHVMTFEAVRGAEQYRTRAATNTMFPFTRNVVGGMDYTPVAFLVSDRDTTDAHEVASFLVFESGWQHTADRPENYDARPEALRTLNQLPTAWDETRLLAGRPGRDVMLARRAGDRWYVGALSAVAAKTFEAPLSFLGAGRWLVETLRDGPHGLLRETRIVQRTDRLAVPVATNGGFVSAVCPYRTGLSTCDRPVRRVPRTTLTVTPAQAEIRAGGTVEVTGTFALPSGGPLTEVRLSAAPRTGWTASGSAVTRNVLRGGESISGRWRFTATANAASGDLPVVATYRYPADPAQLTVHVEEAVRVMVAPTGTPYASDLAFLTETNGWGPVERDTSNGESAGGDGATLTIGGTTYAKGIGMHAPGAITVWLGGACTRFRADVGIDAEVTEPGSAAFQVLGDDRPLIDSGTVRSGDGARPLDVDVTGVRVLTLRATDGGDGRNFDHADWGGARLTCS